jgi:chromosomal replication initiation ATPase DnaA
MYTEEPSVRVFNPDFVARVYAKRREEAEAKALADRAAGIARKARERQMRREVAAEQRKLAMQRERAAAAAMPYSVFRRVEERACATFNVLRHELYTERRGHDIVFVRHFIAYWAVRLTKLSYAEIGRRMGRDHSTILVGVPKYIEKRAKMGRTLRRVR